MVFLTVKASTAGRPTGTPCVRSGGSSWQSLARGTGDIEADYLNGEIVLLGRLHGVPTRANRVVQRVATRMARERAAPASLPLAELRKMIESEPD